jgi:hypothetical protein
VAGRETCRVLLPPMPPLVSNLAEGVREVEQRSHLLASSRAEGPVAARIVGPECGKVEGPEEVQNRSPHLWLGEVPEAAHTHRVGNATVAGRGVVRKLSGRPVGGRVGGPEGEHSLMSPSAAAAAAVNSSLTPPLNLTLISTVGGCIGFVGAVVGRDEGRGPHLLYLCCRNTWLSLCVVCVYVAQSTCTRRPF